MCREKVRKDKKSIEFSKVIVVMAIVMWLSVNTFGMVMMAITQNLSPMIYVIGSVDAVMAIICTGYAWKAKAENIVKLKKIYGIDVSNVTVDTIIKNNHYDHEYHDSGVYGDDGPLWEDTSIL